MVVGRGLPPIEDGGQIRPGGFQCHAGPETRDHTTQADLVLITQIDGERQPQIRFFRKPESGRHDPDDRSALAFQRDRPANYLTVAAKTPSPEAVTQYQTGSPPSTHSAGVKARPSA